ncbi:MAG TPA: hypothetical protein VI612_04960 [Candidatus Nanoarchaeia archaeon]|nr:hypothetical protein [Candidatus Nanoarchaeia archaeon]
MAKRKNKWNKFIIAGIAIAVILIAFNFYLMSQLKDLQPAPKKMRMMLTEWDEAKARELMDANNDGKCDICGMSIDKCISSGMMQCSGMDPNARIGLLESQHIHADWKIYIDGKLLDLAQYSHMQRMKENKSVSSFIHVDSGAPEPEKIGDIIHMHATGVPLNFFFESIGMRLDGDCLQINDKKHCGIKIYVNGKENAELGDYVFNDDDKILITDGKDVEKQMSSITNFAEVH